MALCVRRLTRANISVGEIPGRIVLGTLREVVPMPGACYAVSSSVKSARGETQSHCTCMFYWSRWCWGADGWIPAPSMAPSLPLPPFLCLLHRRKPCSSCRRTPRPSVASMLTTLTSHWSITASMKPLRNCKKPSTGHAVLHSGCPSPGFTKLAEQGERLWAPVEP